MFHESPVVLFAVGLEVAHLGRMVEMNKKRVAICREGRVPLQVNFSVE